MIIAHKCTGEGQGSCKRCTDNGKWNRTWMCFLYHIDGLDGCYCGGCVRAIATESNEQYEFRNDMSECGGNMESVASAIHVDLSSFGQS